MRVISYGEDPLTLLVLTARISEFLDAVGDPSAPEQTLVVYRPSFGRNSSKATGRTLRSEFGEFDAIVATEASIYLVEAKWDGSSELEAGKIVLRPEQRRRHEVLKWYLNHWRTAGALDWSEFCERESASFQGQFQRMTLPRPGTILARNLEYLLRELSGRANRVQDVLLFSSVGDGPLPTSVEPDSFRLVTFREPAVGGAGYIELRSNR